MKSIVNAACALFALTAAGCAADIGDAAIAGEGELGSHDLAALLSANGLMSINGLTASNGLMSINGAVNVNAITTKGPLNGSGLLSANTPEGANGLMSTSGGRDTVAYLVKCALPPTRSIVKKDQAGVSYTFTGALGFAPAWETTSCDATCQEWVTACLIAHVNTAGVHVPLWLTASHPTVGFGASTSYPLQEGSFMGNIFKSPPVAYYCNGQDFGESVVAGRIGATQTNTPYQRLDAYPGGQKRCVSACEWSNTSFFPGKPDGYTHCYEFNHVVTVWRK